MQNVCENLMMVDNNIANKAALILAIGDPILPKCYLPFKAFLYALRCIEVPPNNI